VHEVDPVYWPGILQPSIYVLYPNVDIFFSTSRLCIQLRISGHMLRKLSTVLILRFLISPIDGLTLSCKVRIWILIPSTRILIFTTS
jgi:hypothetical protein